MHRALAIGVATVAALATGLPAAVCHAVGVGEHACCCARATSHGPRSLLAPPDCCAQGRRSAGAEPLPSTGAAPPELTPVAPPPALAVVAPPPGRVTAVGAPPERRAHAPPVALRLRL